MVWPVQVVFPGFLIHYISGRGQKGISLSCSQGNSSHLLKRTFSLYEWNPEGLKSPLADFQNRLVH